MRLVRIGVYDDVVRYENGCERYTQDKNEDFFIDADKIIGIGFYGSRAVIWIDGMNKMEVDASNARSLIDRMAS